MEYDEIISECKKKCRYGDLWQEFSVDELVFYSYIKGKRGRILYRRGMTDFAKDDIMDSINIGIMAIQKIEEDINNVSNYSTLPKQ